MRIVITSCATVFLLVAAGCGPAGGGSTGSSPPPRSARAASSTSPTPAPPTDAAGQPVVRPGCVEPGEGHYRHVPGPTAIASVLILGSGPLGVVVGAQANG